MERQKFYYKLCTIHKEKLFSYTDQSQEFYIGQVITQDPSSPAQCIPVYRSPEQAALSETSSKFPSLSLKSTKPPQKSIIKLMCWGQNLESHPKLYFSNMCIIENTGPPKIAAFPLKKSSFLRPQNRKNRKIEVSPKSFRSSQKNSPLRIYSGLLSNNGSPSHRRNLSVPRGRIKVDEVLRKMKEDSEKIDNEIKNIERWNQICELEFKDTEQSSEF